MKNKREKQNPEGSESKRKISLKIRWRFSGKDDKIVLNEKTYTTNEKSFYNEPLGDSLYSYHISDKIIILPDDVLKDLQLQKLNIYINTKNDIPNKGFIDIEREVKFLYEDIIISERR